MRSVSGKLFAYIAGVLSVFMLAPLAIIGMASPVFARGNVPPVEMHDGNYYLDTGIHVSGKTYFGFERLNRDGRVYLCLENLSAPPKNLDNVGKDMENRGLAYLLWKYGEDLIGHGPSSSTVGPRQVNDAVIDANQQQLDAAAIAYIGKIQSQVNDDSEFPESYYPKRIRDRGNELRAEADRLKGPYSVVANLENSDETTMHLSNLGIKADSGSLLPGVRMRLTIDGDAKWAKNGKKNVVARSESDFARYKIDRGNSTSAEEVKVTVEVMDGIPTGGVPILNTARKNGDPDAGQYAVAADTSAIPTHKPKLEKSARFPALDYEYKIDTKESHVHTKGETIIDAKDEIKLSTVKGNFPKGAEVKVKSSLFAYDTPQERAKKANGVKVGTVETMFTEPGTKTTPVVKVPKGMGRKYFAWFESADEVKNENGHAIAWKGDTVRPSEIFDLMESEKDQDNLVITTKTSNLNKDGEIFDNYAIAAEQWGAYVDAKTGETRKPKVDVRFDLYWSQTDPTKDPLVNKKPSDLLADKKIEKVGSTTVKGVTGPTKGELGKTDVVKAAKKYHKGYLTWVANAYPSANQPAEAKRLIAPVSTSFGIPEETVLNKWTPNVITKAQSPVIHKGDKLVDIVKVTGMPNDNLSKVKYECIAWGPFLNAPTPGKQLPANAKEASRGTITLTKNGEYKCDAGVVKDSGYYVFTEKSYGDKRNNPTEDRTVYSKETTLAKFNPVVTTKAQDQTTKLGTDGKGKIADNVSIRKGHPNDTVKITVYQNGPTLHKPAKETDSLTALKADNAVRVKNGEKARVLPKGNNDKSMPSQTFTIQLDAKGNADFRTKDFIINESGYYWFTYKLESTDMTEPSVETKVKHEETSLVKWRPVVKTRAQNEIIKPGQKLVDNIIVQGIPSGNDSNITAECIAWGPFKEKPKPGETIGEGKLKNAKEAARGKVVVKKNGTHKCDAGNVSTKPSASGYYVFTEKTSGDTRTEGTENKKVYAEETTLVNYNPKITTRAQDQVVDLDDKGEARIADNLKIWGGSPNDTVRVTVALRGSTLYKPKTGVTSKDALEKDLKDRKVEYKEKGNKKPAAPEKDKRVSTISNAPWWGKTEEDKLTTEKSLEPYYHKLLDTLRDKDPDWVTRNSDAVDADGAFGPTAHAKTFKVKLDGNGKAELRTEDFLVNEAGYYWFTYTLHPTPETNKTEDDTVHDEETTFVKWHPHVETTAQKQELSFNKDGVAEISDILRVWGMRPFHSVDIEVTGNGPDKHAKVKDGAQTPEGTPQIGTKTVKVVANKNGEAIVRTEPFKVNEPGHYWFTYKHKPTPHTTGIEDNLKHKRETTFVKYQPKVTTVAEKQKVQLKNGKAQIRDTMHVSEGRPGDTVTIKVCVAGGSKEKPKPTGDQSKPGIAYTASKEKVHEGMPTVPTEQPTPSDVVDTPGEEPSQSPTDAPTGKPEDEATKYALKVSPKEITSGDFVTKEKGVTLTVTGLKPNEKFSYSVAKKDGGKVETLFKDVQADKNGIWAYTVYGQKGSNGKAGFLGNYEVTVKSSQGELNDTFKVTDTPGQDGSDEEGSDSSGDVKRKFEIGAPRPLPESSNCKDVQVKLDDNGEATVKTEPFEVNKEGYYYFTYSSPGNDSTDGFEDGNIYKEETVFVKPEPVMPGGDVAEGKPEGKDGASAKTGGSAATPVALIIGGVLLIAGGVGGAVVAYRRTKKQ